MPQQRLRVFVSWSGERSRVVAEALRSWIPLMIDEPEVWLSSRDIPEGNRWILELADTLQRSEFGVLVLTPENLRSAWLLFEAGALSKSVNQSCVVPYLVGLDTNMLSGPLAHFQAVQADREGTRKLVDRVLKASGSNASPDVLRKRFEVFWAEIEPILANSHVQRAGEGSLSESFPERTIASLQQQIADLTSLIRQLVPPVNAPSHMPDSNIADSAELQTLNGAWVATDGGLHMYIRTMGDRIAAPYCFNGNSELDSAFFAWQRIGDRFFARFRWFNESFRGFAFFQFLDRDTLHGNWWITNESDWLAPARDLSDVGGVPITLKRDSSEVVPRWAERYFDDGAPDPHPHQTA